MSDYPQSLLDFQQRFPDERACADYLIEIRWSESFVCPPCDSSKAWALLTKAFVHECARCHKQTSVTGGRSAKGKRLIAGAVEIKDGRPGRHSKDRRSGSLVRPEKTSNIMS